MGSFVERMVRAAKLDKSVYEEVEADPTATMQAILVVVLASLASAIGTWTASAFPLAIIGSLVSWAVFAASVYLVGAKLLREPTTRSDVPELLRTIGFASSPLILNVLGIIPFLIVIIGPITLVWWLIATVVAVRQALDYTSTGRAVIVCIIAWFLFIAVRATIAMITGGLV
jgi:hypothetical protein